jgi:uncharacterized protein DUF1189
MGAARRYRIWHPLFLSFFSRSLYQDVGRRWKGIGFLYLLLILALSWLFVTIHLHRMVSGLATVFSPLLLEQVPTLTITDGVVSIREPQPYTIRYPITEAPLVIIDTTGQTRSLEGTPAQALVTRNQVYVRKSDAETRVYDLSKIRYFAFDRARVERWIGWFRRWFAVGVYPFALAFSYLYRIVQALFYAAIGLGLARLLRVDLRYPALLRLSAVSVTPAMAVDTLRDVTGAWIPHWWLICFLIAMGYLAFAVRANATPQAGSPNGPA